MAKLRVLHVIDKLSMDGENPSSCAKLIADWFAEHSDSVEPYLCCIKGPDGSDLFFVNKEIDVIYLKKGKYSISVIKDLKGLIRSRKIDIVHLHGYSSANFGRIAAKKVGCKVVMHEHAILKVLPHQSLVDWMLKNKTDAAIGVSEAVKYFLITGRHAPPDKTRVIWNGINFSFLKNIENERHVFREKYGITDQQILIGSVTRLFEIKGNNFFIEAAQKVAKDFPEARFILFGDGPLKSEYEKQITDLGLRDIFFLAGFVDNLTAAYGALDVFVLSSLMEGFGIALAEAMAAGKPVVASSVGGINEMVTDGHDGLLVPPQNCERLADGIKSYLSDWSLAGKIKANAKEKSRLFSIEKNVESLESLYHELVEN